MGAICYTTTGLSGIHPDADRSLGRLDGVASVLPNPDLFVAMYVRHEAVLSSQIEGTQSTLEDVLEFEAESLREERYVGVAEEGGKDLISTDPLAPGSVYVSSVDSQGKKVGLYRLEIGSSAGTGKLKMSGTIDSTMKESIQREWYIFPGKLRRTESHGIGKGGLSVFAALRRRAEMVQCTAFRINRQLGQRGKFWQQEPFDHLVRSVQQYEYLRGYIADNPIKAKLRPGEYYYRRSEAESSV